MIGVMEKVHHVLQPKDHMCGTMMNETQENAPLPGPLSPVPQIPHTNGICIQQ